MKGKIDKQGDLLIERAGMLKAQYCPCDGNTCGDSCPKFGEPYQDRSLITNEIGCVLKLCDNDQLFFTELIDERK